MAGKYNICYVNGFQTQVEQKRFWHRHWSLVLKDHGKPVVDSVWGEWLLDTRTPAKRKALARIMGRWTDRCARDGFAAVEYDNLDSFSRSHHLLTRADNKKYAARLVDARAWRRPGGRAEELGRVGRHGASASTSRSPSSAGSTASAAATSTTTATTCWRWSTTRRRSGGPAPIGPTGSPWYAATST